MNTDISIMIYDISNLWFERQILNFFFEGSGSQNIYTGASLYFAVKTHSAYYAANLQCQSLNSVAGRRGGNKTQPCPFKAENLAKF